MRFIVQNEATRIRFCKVSAFFWLSKSRCVGTSMIMVDAYPGAPSGHILETFGERLPPSVGFEVVATFYDAALSGADPLDERPGIAAMLERIAGNGVRTILVEAASRLARDLIVQETGFWRLRELRIDIVAVDSPGR